MKDFTVEAAAVVIVCLSVFLQWNLHNQERKQILELGWRISVFTQLRAFELLIARETQCCLPPFYGVLASLACYTVSALPHQLEAQMDKFLHTAKSSGQDKSCQVDLIFPNQELDGMSQDILSREATLAAQ